MDDRDAAFNEINAIRREAGLELIDLATFSRMSDEEILAAYRNAEEIKRSYGVKPPASPKTRKTIYILAGVVCALVVIILVFMLFRPAPAASGPEYQPLLPADQESPGAGIIPGGENIIACICDEVAGSCSNSCYCDPDCS